MKILTLNTHSLIESEYETKLLQFVEMMKNEKPDIVGLQEVNQSIKSPIRPSVMLKGYTRCKGYSGVVRMDNHAARIAELLLENGLVYYWTWIPVKIGYGIYDEGIAMFSSRPILETQQCPTSRVQDYQNWKTRKILGIRTEHDENTWYYTVHMGWWDDEDEPFKNQWDKAEDALKEEKKVWVMGDFNSPAQVRDEGYDYVKNHGWNDSYCMAEAQDSGDTVEGVIDGWREKGVSGSGMRIDHIWSKHKVKVKSSQVVFNGKQYPVISDHYGVMIIIEGENKYE